LEIQVQISKDYTSAFIYVSVKEVEDDFILNVPLLEEALSNEGVVIGIKRDVLNDICKYKKFNQKILVAECIEPQTGDDARVEIIKKPKRADEITPIITDDGEVDYYSPREGFIAYVRKGETIAIRYPPTRGEAGENILGRVMPGKFGKEISLDLFKGSDTKIAGDTLIAGCDGIISIKGLQVNVESTYQINDNIGRNTGSIDIPKELDITLMIQGDIQRGLSVKCHKLFVSGCIEDAKIDCNYLNVKGGIVGVGDKPIEADHISVGFINGERKVIGKTVNVLREISSGAQVMAETVKAYTIQGTSIMSKEAIWTDYINGKNTIMVGLNYKAKMEYDELSMKIAEIREPLEELRNVSYAGAKRMKQLKELSKLNPKHPLLQKELPKILEIKEKLGKFEELNETLYKRREECEKKIYSAGEPFLFIKSGFSKDTSSGMTVEPDTTIFLKEHSMKVYESTRGGLYYISKYGISSSTRYNTRELKEKFNKFVEIIEEDIKKRFEQSQNQTD